MEHPKIVVTGGPSAGKTTVLGWTKDWLKEFGIAVHIAPEAATYLIKHKGLLPGTPGFQEEVVKRTIHTERVVRARAQRKKRAVIFCDRGLCDAAAYASRDEIERILNGYGMTYAHARDIRYDGVIHMRTAALGAPEHYTLTNNAARTESPDEAIALDERTLATWVGCPHLIVIENPPGGMEAKYAKFRAAVCRMLGIPVPLEIEKKYLVAGHNVSCFPEHRQVIEIEQIYLSPLPDGTERRVRKRTQGATHAYYYTEKLLLGPATRAERERHITKEEYLRLSTERDPTSRIIQKRRTCFVWKSQYFEMDEFAGDDLVLLEIELTERQEEPDIPPWIRCFEEVTDNPRYKNAEIARRLLV